MAYRVERSEESDRDLEMLFDFLFDSYQAFGDNTEEACARAAARVRGSERAMMALGDIPHQGTLLPNVMPGLRSVTKDRVIFYFLVDDDRRTVQVLAIFFGGQDHRREMLKRVLGA